MSGAKKELKCLICRAPTIHAHMGIEACRPCAVFYKRSIKHKYKLTCIDGNNNYSSGDQLTSCRKCRYERFKEIYERASSCEIERDSDDEMARGSGDERVNGKIPNPETSPQSEYSPLSKAVGSASPSSDFPEHKFIDHTSYFDSDPSGSATPLLDKMKRAYSTLCLVRKSGEMSALHHLLMHAQPRDGKMSIRPAKYSNMIPYSHIFFSGVIDFARSSFADFNEMTTEWKHTLVERNFQLIQSLDGSYRGHHYFPNDDTVMATYATYLNDSTLRQFFEDCPPEVDKDEAVKQFTTNMKLTIKNTKLELGKVNPTIDEFIALFGLTLRNDYSGNFESEMTARIKTNREAILKELRTVYSRKGMTEYAPRMGKLLFLLANEERVLDITNEHVQMYRMMNIFNEAYEEEKK
ncbi:hypothetical protein PRIPAC_95309 [Pristionchus pacificus]|uniref:Nuclear receptor n=1 Tax=Pristionchus pacificus TaxID=54126 RepID=A0A2A6D2B3_PRIPA|nr:hypothetical protein PRIPAC_95309 [Pristionchus pacificus]|eukprot:PDM84486.1 nuclear receptor [Pristionchus pacificus]